MSDHTMIDVTPAQLAGAIDAAFAANIPLMVWGDGGLGKSRIAEQRAQRAGRIYTDVRLLVKDLPDLQGYPVIAGMREGAPVPLTAPADLPPSDSTAAHCIVFEELPGASRMVMGGAYGLILERRLNSYSLPRDTRVLATGNLASSGGVVNSMPRPLANRFAHVRLVCTPAQHQAYAMAAGWHPLVIAYHNLTTGTAWSSYDVKSKEETFASPRSWEMASDLLKSGALPADILTQMLSGILGYGVGGQFAAFVSLYSTLAPTLDAMIDDPQNCPIPKDAASQWFIGASVADQWTPADTWCLPVLARLGDEITVMAVDIACRRNPQLARTPEFITLFAGNPRYAALARFVS